MSLDRDSVILVFAKAPQPGRVNTRLIPAIGEPAATRLQHDLVHRRLSSLYGAKLCDVVLMCAPDTGHRFFQQCQRRYQVGLQAQQGRALGERLASGVRQALGAYRRVVVLGCDAPALPLSSIRFALERLRQGVDVVLGPAEDGGYVMLATRGDHPSLYRDIDWGTERVLAQTLAAIDEAGLQSHLTPPCWDIDRPADYRRYRQWLNRQERPE